MSASIEIKQFKEPADLIHYLDEEISRVRSLLGEYLRRLEEARAHVEKARKTRDALARLAGSKEVPRSSTREISLGELKVILNATAEQEQDIYEQVVKSLQDKVTSLQTLKRSLEPLRSLEETEGATITVATVDSIPISILLTLPT